MAATNHCPHHEARRPSPSIRRQPTRRSCFTTKAPHTPTHTAATCGRRLATWMVVRTSLGMCDVDGRVRVVTCSDARRSNCGPASGRRLVARCVAHAHACWCFPLGYMCSDRSRSPLIVAIVCHPHPVGVPRAPPPRVSVSRLVLAAPSPCESARSKSQSREPSVGGPFSQCAHPVFAALELLPPPVLHHVLHTSLAPVATRPYRLGAIPAHSRPPASRRYPRLALAAPRGGPARQAWMGSK